MAPVTGGEGTTPITGNVAAFSGGAMVAASSGKSKLTGCTSDPVVPKPDRPVLHPTEQYKVRNNGEYKLPKETTKVSKPLGAQTMAPVEKLKGWGAAPVDKPDTGAKMVIRAPAGAPKSKWSVPPRPAAPPPLPLNLSLIHI